MRPTEFDRLAWNRGGRERARAIARLRATMPTGLSAFWDQRPQKARPRKWSLNDLRRELLKRQQCRCAGECGTTWANAYHELDTIDTYFLPYQVDHIQPLFLDGEHALTNMQLLCRPCHQAKTTRERPPGKPQKPKLGPVLLEALVEAERPLTSHEVADLCGLEVRQVTGPLVTLLNNRDVRQLPGTPTRWEAAAVPESEPTRREGWAA